METKNNKFKLKENNDEVKRNAVIQKYLSLFYKDDIFEFYDWMIDNTDNFKSLKRDLALYDKENFKILKKNIFYRIKQRKKEADKIDENAKFFLEEFKDDFKEFEEPKNEPKKYSFFNPIVDIMLDLQEHYSGMPDEYNKAFDKIDKIEKIIKNNIDQLAQKIKNNTIPYLIEKQLGVEKKSVKEQLIFLEPKQNKQNQTKDGNYNDLEEKQDVEDDKKDNKSDNIYDKIDGYNKLDNREKQLFEYIMAIYKNSILDNERREKIFQEIKKDIKAKLNVQKTYLTMIGLDALTYAEAETKRVVYYKEKTRHFIEDNIKDLEGLNFLKQESYKPNKIICILNKEDVKRQTEAFKKIHEKVKYGNFETVKKDIIELCKKYKIYNNEIPQQIEDVLSDENFKLLEEISKQEEEKKKEIYRLECSLEDMCYLEYLVENYTNKEQEQKLNEGLKKYEIEVSSKTENIIKALEEKQEKFQNKSKSCYDDDISLKKDKSKILNNINNVFYKIKEEYVTQKEREIEEIVERISKDNQELKKYLNNLNIGLSQKDIDNNDIKIVNNYKYEKEDFYVDLDTILRKYAIVIYTGNFKSNTILKPHHLADSQFIFMMLDDGNVVKFPDNNEGKERIHWNLFDLQSFIKSKDEDYHFIVEENVMQDKNNDFQRAPYKFYCAGGEVFVCRCAFGKAFDIQYFLDKDFKESEKVKEDCKAANQIRKKYDNSQIDKSKNNDVEQAIKNDLNKLKPGEGSCVLCSQESFRKMWNIASKIAKKYPTIRVDLFCVKQTDGKEKIFFNELEDNCGSNYSIFRENLKPEYIEQYYDMIGYNHLDDKYLSNTGKIIKNLHFKIDKKECKEVSLNLNNRQENIDNGKENIKNNKTNINNCTANISNNTKYFTLNK